MSKKTTAPKIPTFNQHPAKLEFDMNAFIRLDEECNINILDPNGRKINSPVAIRNLIWGGLLHLYPDLTREEVSAQLKFEDIGDWADIILSALERAGKRNETKGV